MTFTICKNFEVKTMSEFSVQIDNLRTQQNTLSSIQKQLQLRSGITILQ